MYVLIKPSDLKESLGMWSVTDIGRRPNRKIVRAEQYIAYERLMVDMGTRFLSRKHNEVKLIGLEFSRSSLNECRMLEAKFNLDKILASKILPYGEVPNLLYMQDMIRLCLRECLWGVFFCGARGIYFGYDLNVYFCGGKVDSAFLSAMQDFGMVCTIERGYPAGFSQAVKDFG